VAGVTDVWRLKALHWDAPDIDAQDPGSQAPVLGREDGGQTQNQDLHAARATHVLRSPSRTRRQAATGRTVRRNALKRNKDAVLTGQVPKQVPYPRKELTVRLLRNRCELCEETGKVLVHQVPAAETWVRHHAQKILAGGATRVAGAIRCAATKAGLEPGRRAGADTCATYLTNKRAYLNYPTALTKGWPIATGVIEGACRHLVKDRMDLTGARWGLHGAEAILKLRALRSNGDFNDYWRYHLDQEHQRVHQSRYLNNAIPRAA
jgi:hypothetical protein